jgi:hypothetical protein
LSGGDDAAAVDCALADADLGVRIGANEIRAAAGFEGELHGGTIALMRELVIVITDVYLPPEGTDALYRGRAGPAGIESVTRFGQRAPLVQGWRPWLARYVGREELAALPAARIAGALLADAPGTEWIATPLRLSTGFGSVHLDHRGLLRLTPDALSSLAQSFERAFAGSGWSLSPLPCGEFLLRTPGIAAVVTPEPACFAGGPMPPGLARGAAAVALRRAAAEIEMWLHAQSPGAHAIGAAQVSANALWPWGAGGTAGEVLPRAATDPVAGFGRDAYLEGLWHLCGGRCRPVPETTADLLRGGERRTVLALSVAAELQASMPMQFTEAVAALDARFIAPALGALREGTLAVLTLIANDTALRVRRGSALKLWRRPRAGLAGLA